MIRFVCETALITGAAFCLLALDAPPWAAFVGGWVAVHLAEIELNTRKRPTP